jgi:hypothetical protein
VKQLQDDHAQLPHDQIAKYHLIFGTRSARAVRYMNDVAFNALTPYLDQFRDGLLFDVTPTRYAPSPAIEVKQAIVAAVANRPLTRPGVYETIVPQFFLQRPSKEYRAIIDELTFKDGLLFPNPLTLKKPGKLNDNTLLSTRAWPTRTR